MPARILGVEYHLPEKIETNEDLAKENPEWQMTKINAKSGIRARRIAAEDETASDLGYQAARKLLDREIVDVDTIDFLLLCTQCPDHYLPSAACTLQHRLGLGKHTGALDFNLGCSGYVYGLYMAKNFVQSGSMRNVLLITADTYTKYINPKDRTVRTLFGDGAAATLIGADGNGRGIIDEFILGTDGAGTNDLIVPSGCLRVPQSDETSQEFTDTSGCVRSRDNLFMDGHAVYSFAINTVPRTIEALLKKTRLAKDDIDWFVYHQANKFMLCDLAKESQIPWKKVSLFMKDVGNTVSSSIPITLANQITTKKIKPGQKAMLIGFGVGYSWGACIIDW